MSIPESFSKGIPIISTELGNPGQMIKESGGGIVYRVNDFDSFRNAIEKMIKDRVLYSKNAYNYFNRFLCPEESYKRMITIYDDAKHIK